MKNFEIILPCPADHFISRTVILLLFLATTSLSCAQAPDNTDDINWLVKSLNLQQGSDVADIGAGDGDQTLAIARLIGPKGKIFSTEIGSSSLKKLQRAVKNSGLENITVVEGQPEVTNLPAQCCDAIYMRRVYHHITNPHGFNESLFKSLKPEGRLVIIDFEPRSSEADPSGRSSGSQHGVTVETVIKELTEAGFELISSEKSSGRNIYVVMKKPENSP